MCVCVCVCTCVCVCVCLCINAHVYVYSICVPIPVCMNRALFCLFIVIDKYHILVGDTLYIDLKLSVSSECSLSVFVGTFSSIQYNVHTYVFYVSNYICTVQLA